MIGNIGQPRKPPAPKLEAVQAALDLMTAFGSGDGEAKRVLGELKKAIEHNGRLVADVDVKLKAFEDLEKRERELAEVEARADKKLAEIDRIRSSFAAYESDLAAGTL